MKKIIYAILLVLLSCQIFAADRYHFQSPKQDAQFQYLIKEMRCMVCSHQNLAESNAPLAMDMKQVIYQQVINGQSDSDIIQYMTSRYGDVILFKPPLKSMTWVLWFAPFILLVLGAFLFRKMVYRVSLS
jgi:cytochrome c-type biogenesis protein CcmH